MQQIKPIIWLTGQPGSGKTTLAQKLAHQFPGEIPFLIDGDELRAAFGNFGYDKAGRYENIRTAQKIALFMQSKGYLVIVALVAPYKELREEFKAKTKVAEVYLHYDEDRGKNKFFSADYEPPTENKLSVNTTKNSVDACAKVIKEFYYLSKELI